MSRIYLSPPHMSGEELRLVADAFSSNWVAPLGPHVDGFERELAAYVGIDNACALSSGTAALHLALILLGVGQGDEVLTSTLTFAATANAITYMGAKPVFVDCDRATWNMDPELLAEAIQARAKLGRLPKAVIVVDLYGQCADYDRINAVCREHDIPVVEDAAEALGASYRGRAAGAFGTIGTFSFNGNKIITTAGGGMLVSENRVLTDQARFLATQARDPAPHYEHSVVGYNYRMSNILAAIGRGQLAVLDQRVNRRREIFDFYERSLGNVPGITFMPEAPYGRSTRWLTCIQVDPLAFGATREDIRKHMEHQDIEARPVWKPMHLQPVFRDCPIIGGQIAAQLFENGLCLPSGSALSASDLELIVEELRSLHQN